MNTLRGLPRVPSRGFISLGILIAIIIGVAILGGGAWYASQKTDRTGDPGEAATSTVQVTSATDNTPFATNAVSEPANGIAVAGMSKYTDVEFGFSFWYPNGWTVTNISEEGPGMFAGTKDKAGNLLKGRIFVRGPDYEITIDKIHSDEGVYNVNPGACGYCGPLTYFFDSNLNSWMKVYPEGPKGTPDATSQQIADAKLPKPVKVTSSTMYGLPVFSTEQRESALVVALSSKDFLFVRDETYTQKCGSGCASPDVNGGAQFLARTITPTNPSAMIPISTAQVIEIIETARNAYTGQATSQEVTQNGEVVKFDLDKDNIYAIRVGNSITIPKSAYINPAHILYVVSTENNVVRVVIKAPGRKPESAEHSVALNESVGFFGLCPEFKVTPLSIQDGIVTVSVRNIYCVL